jgi:hypothetical protein
MANQKQNRGCLSIFFPFSSAEPDEVPEKELPYRVRDDFLSPAEFSFYKVLYSLVNPRLTIQSKVRLADIFFVANPNENIKFFNYISAKHIDFLICDSVNMKPLLGIELDDSSHEAQKRQRRDDFVERTFQAAKLPLVHIKTQHDYNSREIAAQIAPYIREKFAKETPQAEGATQPNTSELTGQQFSAPICPKCGIPMVLRTVSKGEHQGKQFWGCKNYPKCREVKAFNG